MACLSTRVRITFFAEPRDANRFSTLKTMDLRISKFFNVQRHRFEVIGDFFNLFNVNTVTNVNPNSGSDFGKPTDILGPRVFRLGGRWTFWSARRALAGSQPSARQLGVAAQLAAGLDGPTFIDVARSAGLIHKIVFGGSERNTYILETTGTGVAFFDYDADGALDLLFTNGATIGHEATAPSLRLYRGNGSGVFTDVTDRAGVGRSGWGQGVAVADYDNDGFEDIYLTFFGKNILFHNNRNGTFTDVSARAGVAAGG